MTIAIERIDHLVITATDPEATAQFYHRALGMEIVRFDGARLALRFGDQKINLHQQGKEIKPNAPNAQPGTIDLCFVTRTPLREVMDHLRAQGVELVHGPVRQTGALGPMDSVYIRDPDGNLIEIAVYPPPSPS